MLVLDRPAASRCGWLPAMRPRRRNMTGRTKAAWRTSAGLLRCWCSCWSCWPAAPGFRRSGPVGKSSERSAGNLSAPVFLPAAPQPGAPRKPSSKTSTVPAAATRTTTPWRAQYLTQASSVSWKPDQRALVYREARVVRNATPKTSTTTNWTSPTPWTPTGSQPSRRREPSRTSRSPLPRWTVNGGSRPPGRHRHRRGNLQGDLRRVSHLLLRPHVSPTPFRTSAGSSRTKPSRQ